MAEESIVVRRDGRTRIKDMEEIDTKGLVPAVVEDEAGDSSIALVPSLGHDIIVMANTPQGLAQSQNQLIAWVERKVEQVIQEVNVLQENLDAAVEAKVATRTWKNLLLAGKRKLRYYEKMQDALVAGYYIVPDFPINVIAVRTKKTEPSNAGHQNRWSHGHGEERAQALPTGEGEYVNPKPPTYTDHFPVTRKNKDNTTTEDYEKRWVVCNEFADIDFPMRLIRPQIMRDFSKALKSKIFDEIGVLPDTSRSPDPMIVGRIRLSSGNNPVKTLSFLISWWIPTETL
jgi:hypothetical protein